jgi:hypothetical protein
MTQQIGIPLDLSQLADLMAGKAPERRDTRPNPQMGAGMPDIQAVRLRELWAVYSQKPGAGAFQPGQLVTMDPAFAGVEPLRFPAQGYPAVVVSTSPQQDYSLLDQASDRPIQHNDIVIGILMGDEDHQSFSFYAMDARLLVAWTEA